MINIFTNLKKKSILHPTPHTMSPSQLPHYSPHDPNPNSLPRNFPRQHPYFPTASLSWYAGSKIPCIGYSKSRYAVTRSSKYQNRKFQQDQLQLDQVKSFIMSVGPSVQLRWSNSFIAIISVLQETTTLRTHSSIRRKKNNIPWNK